MVTVEVDFNEVQGTDLVYGKAPEPITVGQEVLAHDPDPAVVDDFPGHIIKVERKRVLVKLDW